MKSRSGKPDENWFTRDHIKNDLRRQSLKGALNKFATNGFSSIFSIASVMVLARLLTPKDFGLIAMVMTVTEFARSFRELGLGTLTVQREELTQAQVSFLFWINIGFGLILMLVLISLSPVIAWFYGEKRLLSLSMVLSLVFIFGGFAVQHRALLERQMKFGYLGVTTILSCFGGFCIAIFLAFRGFGVWALVASEIVSAGLYALGVWFFCQWIPDRPMKNREFGSSMRFGSDVSAFEIIQYLSRNIDRILIGRIYGASSLGLYAKAFQLAMMPIEQIRMIFWDIGLSPLSALQSEPLKFRNYYSRFLSIMSLLYMPFVVVLTLKSEMVVLLLLGENWISAAPILRIIAIGGFFRPVIASFQLAMIACNRTRQYLVWGVINALIMITAFGLGIIWGVIGMACAYAVAGVVSLFAAFFFCLKGTPLDPALVFENIKIPLLASWAAGLIITLMPADICPANVLLNLSGQAGILFLSYFGILLCIPLARRQISEVWSYRKELFAKA